MERNIVVESIKGFLPEKSDVEIVERKGIGHPDSIADGIAEEVSVSLCKEYLKRFGTLMHHNTDQCEVIGGEVKVEFGGGEILRPIEIILSGRATSIVNDENVPVHEIAIEAARNYIKNSLPHLDIEEGLIVESKIGRGSADLVNVFARNKEIPMANDTSFGVGFAPYTTLENLVLKAEEFLNSKEMKRKYPFIGEDIKVMGLRIKDEIHLTVAMAVISKYINDASEYLAGKEEVLKELIDYLSSLCENKLNIYINTGDNEKGDKPSDFYLTLTGTSAEMGDDGSVGRGNRVSGLITPYRPMSMEAAAGKNPFNHVGKIYNILAFKIANRIVEEVDNVNNVLVRILSQIGKPIDKPKVASVEIDGDNYNEQEIKEIVDEELANIKSITQGIIERKFRIF